MTIKELLSLYPKQLKASSSSPLLDIELLLAKALNKPKEYLYQYPEKKITAKQQNDFNKLFKRRSKGEPIAYLLGHKEFFGLDFIVNKNVLIPRPETELLVEETLRYLKNHSADSIIDLGAGSGAIIIALTKNCLGLKFYATDISAKALTLAQQNAQKNKVKIKFLKGNLFLPLFKTPNSEFLIHNSIITANLPYLTKKELRNPTLKYEPQIAFDGGDDGLKVFREFFSQIIKYNLRPQAIFLEIGYNQADKIKKLARKILPAYKFKIAQDLCGFDRVAIIAK